MRRLATLSSFLFLAGAPAVALADRQPSRPADDGADDNKADDAKTDDEKADEGKTDDEKADKKADKKADDNKSGSCSVAEEDDAMLGLAALVLLVSGAALRRR